MGVSAQDTISQVPHFRGFFVSLGTHVSGFSVRDKETSPLIYHGMLPGVQLGAGLYGKKIAAWFNYSFSYGKLTTRNYGASDVDKSTAYNGLLDIAVVRKIKIAESSCLYLGPKLALIVNIRNNGKFDNANFNWEGFAMLGPVMLWEKQLTLNQNRTNIGAIQAPVSRRGIKLSASLFIPVISEVSRPPYNTIGDFVDGLERIFQVNQLKLVSFNQFASIVSTLGASYHWQNGHGLKLSYTWYYFNYYPVDNKVSGIQGNVSLSLMVRLGKK